MLGGIARLLRSFFSYLQQLRKFSSGKPLLYCLSYLRWSLVIKFQVTSHRIEMCSGWVLLLDFIKNSILNGSKEVALAAINCLQTFVGANCPKVSSKKKRISLEFSIYIVILYCMYDRSYLVWSALQTCLLYSP